MPRLVIADSDALFRSFLRSVLEKNAAFEVAAEVENCGELMQALRVHRPDLALIDLGLARGGGLEVTRWIKRQWPQVRVVVFAEVALEAYRRAAERAGVDGFVSKDADRGRILSALGWQDRILRKTA